MKPSFSPLAILASSTATLALAQNTTLPFAECILPCDQAALASVGCTASDILCHCEHTDILFTTIVDCVLNNSTCGANATSDLLSFGAFADGTCIPYNITGPPISDFFPNATATNGTTGTNGTSGGSGTSGSNTTVSTTPTPSVYTGTAAGHVGQAGVWVALVCVAAVAFTL